MIMAAEDCWGAIISLPKKNIPEGVYKKGCEQQRGWLKSPV